MSPPFFGMRLRTSEFLSEEMEKHLADTRGVDEAERIALIRERMAEAYKTAYRMEVLP